jgi:hypothetical protein
MRRKRCVWTQGTTGKIRSIADRVSRNEVRQVIVLLSLVRDVAYYNKAAAPCSANKGLLHSLQLDGNGWLWKGDFQLKPRTRNRCTYDGH